MLNAAIEQALAILSILAVGAPARRRGVKQLVLPTSAVRHCELSRGASPRRSGRSRPMAKSSLSGEKRLAGALMNRGCLVGKLAQIWVVPRLDPGIKIAAILAHTWSQLDQWERKSDEEDPDSH
jgi:hypothetical protein